MTSRQMAYAPLSTSHSRALSSLDQLDRTLTRELARPVESDDQFHPSRPCTPMSLAHSRHCASRPLGASSARYSHSVRNRRPGSPPRSSRDGRAQLTQIVSAGVGVVAAGLAIASGAGMIAITLRDIYSWAGKDRQKEYVVLCAGFSSLVSGFLLGLLDLTGLICAIKMKVGTNPGPWALANGLGYVASVPIIISGPISQPNHSWLSGVGISLAVAGVLRSVAGAVHAIVGAQYVAHHTFSLNTMQRAAWDPEKSTSPVALYSTEGRGAREDSDMDSTAPYSTPGSPLALSTSTHVGSSHPDVRAHDAGQTGFVAEPQSPPDAAQPPPHPHSTQDMMGTPNPWDGSAFVTQGPDVKDNPAPVNVANSVPTVDTPEPRSAVEAMSLLYPFAVSESNGSHLEHTDTAAVLSSVSGEARWAANPAVQGHAELVDQPRRRYTSDVASVHQRSHVQVDGLGELELSSDSESDYGSPVDSRLPSSLVVPTERRNVPSLSLGERQQFKEARAIKRALSQRSSHASLTSAPVSTPSSRARVQAAQARVVTLTEEHR